MENNELTAEERIDRAIAFESASSCYLSAISNVVKRAEDRKEALGLLFWQIDSAQENSNHLVHILETGKWPRGEEWCVETQTAQWIDITPGKLREWANRVETTSQKKFDAKG